VSEHKTTIQETLFSVDEGGKRQSAMADVVGPELCTYMRRLLRQGQMLGAEHNQIAVTAREFVEKLDAMFAAHDETSFTLQMTPENFFLSGQLIKFDVRSFERLETLRKAFLDSQVNQVEFSKGIGAGELCELVIAAKMVERGELPTLELFKQPHLKISLATNLDDGGKTKAKDEHRKVVEIYAGLLIKTLLYFARLKRGATPSTRHIKRLLQKMSDQLDDHSDVFVGLLHMRLLPAQEFVHSANTAVLSMVMARAVGLTRHDVVRCGMTAISRDIHRVRGLVEQEEEIELGAESHFKTNLSSVMTLSQMGTNDLVSALRLVTTYERGFPYNKPLPEFWYHEDMRPHLLSRIIEIASHFDIWTQGMEGREALTADLALHNLMAQMGTYYDPTLAKLFINVVGVYPVGSTVELSTGERALVIKSPIMELDQRLSNATRPTVKTQGTNTRIMDLSAADHFGVKIVRIVPKEELASQPSAMLLF
jgi:hypothetical protein